MRAVLGGGHVVGVQVVIVSGALVKLEVVAVYMALPARPARVQAVVRLVGPIVKLTKGEKKGKIK